ncbi:MAG: glycosyltransferase 87 family protein [Acidobacteriota bacterium]
MPALFVAALFLGVPAGLLLGSRLGWLERPGSRRALFVALGATVAWTLPYQGVEYLFIKRLSIGIALAAVALLVGRHLGVGWLRCRARRLEAWVALTTLALVSYINFFDFHGERTWVHLHDAAHYYLGAKYYGELGYSDLYTAMLRAEAETHRNRFKAVEARDLETYDQVHIRTLLRRSDPVKAAFTAERWTQFRADVDLFRQRLGPHYGRVLLDHGFNPTPVWALLGGAFARWVPAGSDRGLLALCLLDLLLLGAVALMVGRGFGVETMLVAATFFCIAFGATFGWVGGAFLRYPWLFGVVAGAVCIHRRRHGAAGALFAAAAMLRVFPALLLLPLGAKAVHLAWRRRAPARRHVHFFGAFAATAAVLFAATAALPKGVEHWSDFRDNMNHHVANISPNVVGLTELLALKPDAPQKVTAEEFRALKERRRSIHRAQLLWVFVPLAVALAWGARRRTDLGALCLGLPLLYGGLSLAAYYWIVLLVLLLAVRHRPPHVAALFAAQLVPLAALQFIERDASVHILYGLALVLLFVTVLGPRPAHRRRS